MFPDYLDGARVLEYTAPGHFGFITDYDDAGNPFDREVRYLAICAYTGSPYLLLFYCDDDYNVITDDCGNSAEDFKRSHRGAIWQVKNTHFLCNAAQRKARGGTLYFEFQRGRHQGKHWLDRSVYLYADLFDQLNLYELFVQALPHFDYYYLTEVTPEQYEKLASLALARGGDTAALFRELDHWVRDCFLTENVFTICGI